MNNAMTALMVGAAITAAPAHADITISLGASAPTYSTTLTFDEPGTPTGVVPSSTWISTHGVDITAGDGQSVVNNFSTTPGQAWLGTDNAFLGNFGVFMTFENDLTDFSSQVWDPSGAPSPFGGGAYVFLFDDGVEVANFAFTPSWGGVGDEWININATGGMKFDDVRILGFGFQPLTHIDNTSWNAIPAPASAGLLGLAGLAATRRRRA